MWPLSDNLTVLRYTLVLLFVDVSLGFFPSQFYQNLSTCLEDVVWKTEEEMQEMK